MRKVRTPTRGRLGRVAILIALPIVVACGSHRGDGAHPQDEPIEECEAFLASYEHCLASLGPARIAQARVEQTRSAFRAQAAAGDTARSNLRQKCVANLADLKTTCR